MSRWILRASSRALVLVVAVLMATALSPNAAGAASENGLALTPPMGFNDWNAYGCNVSAALIEQSALYIHDSGMQAAGYRYVNIDDCWLAPARSADGSLVPDPVKFPHGIAAVADYVHGLGLKLGIYEDAGTMTCAGYPGSLGHEDQDARTFAAWGVDYLKYDQCNIPFANYPGETHQQIDTQLYTTMSNALKATGRPIVFSMCNGTDPAAHPWLWGAPVSNLWRTTTDIQDNFASTVTNFEGNAGLYPYAHPGEFNDADMLEIGNGGQSVTEYRSQFSLWSEMASPLIAGTNLTALSPADLAIYTNRRVIAVDQDPRGIQGHIVSAANGLFALTRPLAGGDRSVLLFNSTGRAQTIATTAHAAGLASAGAYRLTDLWSGEQTQSAGTIAAYVPAHGVVMDRVRALPRAQDLAPSAPLAITSDPLAATTGRRLAVTVSLTDDGTRTLRDVSLALDVPRGWSASAPTRTRPGAVAPGQTVTRMFALTAPDSAPALSTVTLHARADWRDGGRHGGQHGAARAEDPTLLVSPVEAPLRTADTTGSSAVFGQAGHAISILAAGTGITPQTTSSHGTRAASDAYATVFEPGGAAAQSTAEVTVTGQTGSTLRPYGSAGLLERPDASAPSGSPEGVALSLGTQGTITMVFDAAGGPVVDTSVSVPAAAHLPVILRLVRTGATVAGAYSTDGGASWTAVGTGAPAAFAAGIPVDAGVFHSSGVAGGATEADFQAFTVR